MAFLKLNQKIWGENWDIS